MSKKKLSETQLKAMHILAGFSTLSIEDRLDIKMHFTLNPDHAELFCLLTLEEQMRFIDKHALNN